MVDTSPVSGVYINGNYLGKTPFTTSQAAGEITLKLVPTITDQNLLPFETKITLSQGIQTVVRREFGNTEDTSSGDILSFESQGDTTAGLIVISTPDNAQVSVDGVPRGFAPYKTGS
ncbi:PEGA domain-containing protein, partial [Staphylococcus aureus]|uniref:PEGA domain-containing protein n=1 Tax=Staphylococcus aureus TaxID=1280 RepID=UPI0039BEC34E